MSENVSVCCHWSVSTTLSCTFMYRSGVSGARVCEKTCRGGRHVSEVKDCVRAASVKLEPVYWCGVMWVWESKNRPVFRWGGVPHDRTQSDCGEHHQIKSQQDFFLHSLGIFLPWSTSLIFPQPLCWHANPERLLLRAAAFGNTSPFLNRPLQSRNPCSGKTTISKTWRILDERVLRDTLDLFQINTRRKTMFRNRNSWNPRQTEFYTLQTTHNSVRSALHDSLGIFFWADVFTGAHL